MYTGDDSGDDSKLFICERHALTDLLQGLKVPCSCGMASNPWTLDSTIQVTAKINEPWLFTSIILSEGACDSPDVPLSPLSSGQEDLVKFTSVSRTLPRESEVCMLLKYVNT